MGVVNNFGGLVSARFMLGLAEGFYSLSSIVPEPHPVFQVVYFQELISSLQHGITEMSKILLFPCSLPALLWQVSIHSFRL
jgi:hypothetical protein